MDSKIDACTAELVITVPSKETRIRFRIQDLKAQRASIVGQRDRDIAERDAEIAEVDALIARCQAVGVVEG